MPRHARSFVFVHVVWATRGRHPLVPPEMDRALAGCIREEVVALRCRALAVGNASDHVHALVQVASSVALATLVQKMKGATSRIFQTPWQEGYFAESVRVGDLEPLASYIADQRAHHDDSLPWSRGRRMPESVTPAAR